MELLAKILKNPTSVDLSDGDYWNTILNQARKAGVMAKLEAHLRSQELWERVPTAAQETMRGSSTYVGFIQRRVLYELTQLERQLSDLPFQIVLLKGAAYIACGARSSVGRGVRDIDILVEKKSIPAIEARLLEQGWTMAEELSGYDEYYYRELSHELPPLRHPDFQFELDVHHDLIPPTMRIGTRTSEMFGSIVSIPGTRYHRLTKEDQLIHSAAHLMTSESLTNGLRDLLDMSALVLEVKERDESLQGLFARARKFGLETPLLDSLAACDRHLGTSAELCTVEERSSRSRVRRITAWIVDGVVFPNTSQRTLKGTLASTMMWWKTQYLRMSLWQLLKHAAIKKLYLPLTNRSPA
ncbi:MAG: nucleotidyltransferase family protein [Pseudomonadota bacterium]